MIAYEDVTDAIANAPDPTGVFTFSVKGFIGRLFSHSGDVNFISDEDDDTPYVILKLFPAKTARNPMPRFVGRAKITITVEATERPNVEPMLPEPEGPHEELPF